MLLESLWQDYFTRLIFNWITSARWWIWRSLEYCILANFISETWQYVRNYRHTLVINPIYYQDDGSLTKKIWPKHLHYYKTQFLDFDRNKSSTEHLVPKLELWVLMFSYQIFKCLICWWFLKELSESICSSHWSHLSLKFIGAGASVFRSCTALTWTLTLPG